MKLNEAYFDTFDDDGPFEVFTNPSNKEMLKIGNKTISFIANDKEKKIICLGLYLST